MIEDRRYTIDISVEVAVLALEKFHIPDFIKEEMERTFRIDIAKIPMFIFASDGKVTPKEAEIISDLIGVDLSVEIIENLMKALDVYSEIVDKKPSLMLQNAVFVDNIIYNMPKERHPVYWNCDTYYTLLCDVIEDVIRINGETDGSARKLIDDYLSFVRDYVNENDEAKKDNPLVGKMILPDENAIGSQDEVSVPDKSGVRAPSKSVVSAPKKS